MLKPDYCQQTPKESLQGPSGRFDPDEPNTVMRVVRGGPFFIQRSVLYSL